MYSVASVNASVDQVGVFFYTCINTTESPRVKESIYVCDQPTNSSYLEQDQVRDKVRFAV